MKRTIWCVLFFLCTVFSYLPLVAGGGIPLRLAPLRYRVPRKVTVNYTLRMRPKTPPSLSLIQPTAQRAASQADLANRPTPALSTTALAVRPLESPFQDEKFLMADAAYERLVSTIYSPAVAAGKFFPPSSALRAWHEHSAPEVQRSLFLQEVQQLKNLAATDPAHYNYLEGQLFDLLCEWKRTSYLPERTFSQLQQALFPHSLAARLRWPDDWAKSSQDITRWPFVKPAEVMTDKPLTFQPELVVLIVNDNEEIAQSAAAQLRHYAGHIFVAYDMGELNHFIDRMKAQHLRPHYIVSDGALGRMISDRDIKLTLKKSFPEIAQEMGFIILSDGLLDFYASHNGYVSYITRIEDHFENLDRLIGGLEEKYHIQATIQQIP